jgi:peptidoglycan/LPS O-acetylase OafA/YrhL
VLGHGGGGIVGRRPALDGLRALAVLAVMAFHTSPAAHGGFLGVDVFFVVSGYLITTLMLREYERTGRIDLRAFYVRRALRLLPALVLMLVITLPLMLTTLRDEVTIPVAEAVGAALLYVANWVSVGAGTGMGPLTHTWSLSIEEQYYLLWPAILVAVLARGGRDRGAGLARWLAIGVVAVVVSRALLWEWTHGTWLYYATTSRADGLLLGTLLAVLLERRGGRLLSARWSEPVAWAGLAGLGVAALTLHIHGGATFTVGLAWVSLCTALVVHHLAVSDDGLLVRLLSLRPLVVVGTISYGLYLYHFPIFQAVQHAHPPYFVQHGLELGLTALVAGASYVLVERPALRLKDRFTARSLRPAAVRVTPEPKPTG